MDNISSQESPLHRAVRDVRTMLQSTLQQTLIGDAPPRDLGAKGRADDGLFGPTSVTWRVHQDSAMLIGGIRALLLQTMHPLAMAGVADHSAYKDDPFGRLRRTSLYVGEVSFAPKADAEAAIAMVRRVHKSVVGTAPDGRTYSANDPHLLAWIHHALVDSFLRAYQQYGEEKLSSADADRYVSEQSVLAEMIGGTDPAPSKSVAELKAWLANIRPELHGTRQARDAAFFLMTVPMPPTMLAPYGVMLGAAVSSLPAFVRRALWLPSSKIGSALVIEPSAKAITRTLTWAMRAPVRRS